MYPPAAVIRPKIEELGHKNIWVLKGQVHFPYMKLKMYGSTYTGHPMIFMICAW